MAPPATVERDAEAPVDPLSGGDDDEGEQAQDIGRLDLPDYRGAPLIRKPRVADHLRMIFVGLWLSPSDIRHPSLPPTGQSIIQHPSQIRVGFLLCLRHVAALVLK